jgi:hypothetical protein
MSSYKYEKSMDLEAQYYLSLPERPTLYGLADHLGISYPTFVQWRREFDSFNKAVKRGLDIRRKNQQLPGSRKYHKTMCKKVMEMFAAGKSKGSVCLALGITYKTLAEWQEEHPDFKLAVEAGKMLEQEHFEQLGYEAMLGKIDDFDTRIWTTIMKNRFDYSDKTEISGNPDKPLESNITVKFIDNKEDDNGI